METLEELSNPNQLSFKMIQGIKEWLRVTHDVWLNDLDITELGKMVISDREIDFSNDPDAKCKKVVLSNGEIHTFNRNDSAFLEAMSFYPAELRIRIMCLKAAEMDTFILNKRKELAKEVSEFLKNKNYVGRESAEPVDWVDTLKDYYQDFGLKKATSPTMFVSNIKSGKISIADAESIFEIMQEEYYIPDLS